MKRERESLVLSMVREFLNQGLPKDELIKAGFNGLKIAESIAEHRHVNYDAPKFKTSAVWWIHHSILLALVRNLKCKMMNKSV